MPTVIEMGSTEHVPDSIIANSKPADNLDPGDAADSLKARGQMSTESSISISSIDIYRLSGKIREAKYLKLPDSDLFKNGRNQSGDPHMTVRHLWVVIGIFIKITFAAHR